MSKVSLGKEAVFRLFLSMRLLAQAQALKSVRLFGRVAGTRAPYYVVESEVTGETPAVAPDSAPSTGGGSEESGGIHEGELTVEYYY